MNALKLILAANKVPSPSTVNQLPYQIQQQSKYVHTQQRNSSVFASPRHNFDFTAKIENKSRSDYSGRNQHEQEVTPMTPECGPPCFGEPPRLDNTRYRPSKSYDREYQQTWTEFAGDSVRSQRGICLFLPVEYNRRKPPAPRCSSATTSRCKLIMEMEGPKLKEASMKIDRSPKTQLCECPRASKNTRCRYKPKKTPKERRQTQYPSFSECKQERLVKPPYVECKCLSGSMCEMWRTYRRLNKRRLHRDG
ncbi:uncharacterized protein LOC115634130 [Scaptodrosophila lebanonensis]|uniref:Uncharacterized protein LOC115634130 n=1 Tax=Drosophila lebanonensis TaxID=7225 RepID=A0A6J2UHE7_DROLE|nr:uncharacterized protein LOC115634130 [Scaptodrosophila lebanonensis]